MTEINKNPKIIMSFVVSFTDLFLVFDLRLLQSLEYQRFQFDK